MKLVLLSVCLIQMFYYETMALSFDNKKQLLLTTTMACKQETGASAGDLRELMTRVLPTTKEGKCMRKCFFQKFDVIKDGKLNIDGFVEIAKITSNNNEKKVAIAKQIAEACVSVSDDDECEYMGKLLECFMQTAKDRGIDGKKMF